MTLRHLLAEEVPQLRPQTHHLPAQVRQPAQLVLVAHHPLLEFFQGCLEVLPLTPQLLHHRLLGEADAEVLVVGFAGRGSLFSAGFGEFVVLLLDCGDGGQSVVHRGQLLPQLLNFHFLLQQLIPQKMRLCPIPILAALPSQTGILQLQLPDLLLQQLQGEVVAGRVRVELHRNAGLLAVRLRGRP